MTTCRSSVLCVVYIPSFSPYLEVLLSVPSLRMRHFVVYALCEMQSSFVLVACATETNAVYRLEVIFT
jgi:hypothetical protein